MAYTGRPPNLSVSMPRGNLMSDPVRTGMPISVPIWAVSHSNSPASTRKVTSTPFSIQHAKQTVKAIVLRARTRQATDCSCITSSWFSFGCARSECGPDTLR